LLFGVLFIALTLMAAVVLLVGLFHTKLPVPKAAVVVAVSVVLLPLQNTVLPAIAMLGNGFTVTFLHVEAVQAFASVMLTQYVVPFACKAAVAVIVLPLAVGRLFGLLLFHV
jgi:hypothetical protein